MLRLPKEDRLRLCSHTEATVVTFRGRRGFYNRGYYCRGFYNRGYYRRGFYNRGYHRRGYNRRGLAALGGLGGLIHIHFQ